MKIFLSRTILLTLTLLSFSQLQAADSIWLRAEGSGWGAPESASCREAERDAEWALERECRYEADGDYWTLHAIHYSNCDCYESGTNYYRCRTRADALCRIWGRN